MITSKPRGTAVSKSVLGFFEREERRILRSRMGKFLVAVERGMPSRTRLPDRPSADIILTLKSLKDSTRYIEALSVLGYEHLKNHPKKFFFRKKHKNGKFHYLHMVKR